ncbi:hypothetical protein [Microbacterium sp. YY-01]|uniref:hypothetical protein n=1 Tax=Microbacterium sp. YY-01 TaxID=3421634 RepID=UPI003D17ACC1
MSQPDTAPRISLVAPIAVWALGAIAAILVGIFVPTSTQPLWAIVALGLCVLIGFAVQMFIGTAQGFIVRVAATLLGTLVAMGIVSAIFALIVLVSG